MEEPARHRVRKTLHSAVQVGELAQGGAEITGGPGCTPGSSPGPGQLELQQCFLRKNGCTHCTHARGPCAVSRPVIPICLWVTCSYHVNALLSANFDDHTRLSPRLLVSGEMQPKRLDGFTKGRPMHGTFGVHFS